MKALYYDLELAPMRTLTWSRYDDRPCKVLQEGYMLCAAWQWLGEERVHYCGINQDRKRFAANPADDYNVACKMHGLLEQADVVIGHNMKRFDRRELNKAFIRIGLDPPSPYVVIDTLSVARNEFRFSSNRLGDLGEYLGLGNKVPHEGIDLWHDCMEGVRGAWTRMREYAMGDITLGLAVYRRMIPWITNHPNVGLYTGVAKCCPKCGSTRLHRKGDRKLVAGTYERYKCVDCGAWSRSRKQIKDAPKPELRLN